LHRILGLPSIRAGSKMRSMTVLHDLSQFSSEMSSTHHLRVASARRNNERFTRTPTSAIVNPKQAGNCIPPHLLVHRARYRNILALPGGDDYLVGQGVGRVPGR
jgi:hypothetical protein